MAHFEELKLLEKAEQLRSQKAQFLELSSSEGTIAQEPQQLSLQSLTAQKFRIAQKAKVAHFEELNSPKRQNNPGAKNLNF